MEATTATKLGTGAEPVESIEWLREFADRYGAAWNALDPQGVVACVAEDVVWEDPALPTPARGRDEVAAFVRSSGVAFPDLNFAEPGEAAISEDRLVVYAPWRMTGTNTGPIDPPGLAPTGRRVDIEGIDVWQFRGGLIWRYRAVYDFAEVSRQLGLMPPRGGRAENLMVRAQRLRAKLPV
jgi:steroid delta-isomerase-like uncharacterized protein